MTNPRCFPLILFAGALMLASVVQAQPIDRRALVSRHDVILTQPEPLNAVALGNGEFAFNADITGLQTFPEYHEKAMPIGILGNWGWHSFPNPQNFSIDTFKFTAFKKYDRQVWYPYIPTDNRDRISDDMLTPEALYLRANPHRLGLGRIGLIMTHADGSRVAIEDLKNVQQKLDLWAGILTSEFEVAGEKVHVETCVHPQRDQVATRVQSPLVANGRIKLQIAFSYPSGSWGLGFEDWSKPDAHDTALVLRAPNRSRLIRTLDSRQSYDVALGYPLGTSLTAGEKHHFLVGAEPGTDKIELTAWFAPAGADPGPDATTSVDTVQRACREHWQGFWNRGGAIDLSGNADPRAAELERRIVLSQYLTAVHSAGSWPPQETGLACNSWYGKFHMEMYWWHVAHFALWGRPDLLEKSLKNLERLLPAAQAMAKRQGCSGAKWAKMTDPSGNESPSWVGPMLVWQQPHPIHLSELVYRAHPNRATLHRYQAIVFETADYIATFMEWDPDRKLYVLGPGISSADEGHVDFARNLNPAMELGYWKWALETAQKWRERLDMPRNPEWDKVLAAFASPPMRDGTYRTLEVPADSAPSWMATWLYGVLPGEGIDKDVMRNTLRAAAANRTNRPQNTVTWGLPMVAMCAARMGEPDLAINLLVGKHDKNPFLPTGNAYRNADQTPLYLPASGGWLTATAMMAAGWDGAPAGTPAPGFPRNWKVKYEGLSPMP